jgi:nucleoside-diphosphate-sugar epimerase
MDIRSDNQVKQPGYEEVFGDEFHFARSTLEIRPKSILVTGSQGMLGNSIAKALNFLQTNGDLGKTKLFLASREWNPNARASWKESKNLQLLVNSDISKIQSKVEVFIHTASPSNIMQINSYQELHHSNVGMLDEILTLEPKRIIYISSGEVYRNDATVEGTHYRDFMNSNKRDWYPIVKLEVESRLERLATESGLEVGIFRLFHTFGPGLKRNDGRSFADILWGAALNQEISLYSPGEQVRSFLYLSDAVEAILRVALATKSGYFLANLGSDLPVTIREFAEQVSSITGSKIKYDLNSTFSHSPNDYLVPIIHNMHMYDWFPKVETKVGIERTIDWIRNSTLS